MCHLGKSNIKKKKTFSAVAKGHSGGGHRLLPLEKDTKRFSCSFAFSAGPQLATGVNHKD